MNQSQQEAQQAGRDWEKRFAKLVGAELVPGSGSAWYAKLDVNGISVLWSLKWTGKETFTVTKSLVREAVHAVDAPGGVGGGVLPGVAIEVDGESFVMFRASDFVGALESEKPLTYQSADPKGAEARRAASRIPALLRD